MSTTSDVIRMIELELAPGMWPPAIERVADRLEAIVPNFNREAFLRRAMKNWEDVNGIDGRYEIDETLTF